MRHGVQGIALVGPTAVGKTALALAMAERIPVEVISVDSRQVYRGMDIGTAKATPAERARVPHHGLDRVDPSERYSAGRFAREARTWIREIRDRGRIPLLVGGTGFFLRALLEPLFEEPPMDPDRGARLDAWLDQLPLAELEHWARTLDPERMARVEPGGRQRLRRVVRVALLTGRPLSGWHRSGAVEGEAGVPLSVVSMEAPAEWVRPRIEARAARMFEEGLVEEVRRLRQAGFDRTAPGMTATGYREVTDLLDGRIDEATARERIASATRAYARRQRTWFRNQLPEDTLRIDAQRPREELVVEIARRLEGPDGGGPG